MIILMIGGTELVIVGLIILVLFGSDKIPNLMRDVGKGMKEIQKAKEEIKKDLDVEDVEIIQDIKEIKEVIKK